ncbi:hypothetical protein ACTXJ5_12425 [Psychrobacter alimentarius]|uniref:hypothetical protein n=1 Tax=Psychrobacter alimentarius TaxID=261164 RepID=UPI003FD259A6
MSDEKNDIDTGFEEKLAEIVDKKSRNRSNHNIYERFISRVQGDDDGDDSENEQSKQMDPLDTDDDAFIFDFYDDTDTSSQAIDSSLTNASSTGPAETDGSADEGNDSQPDTLEPPTPSVIQAVPVQDRLASSKKPLIIGMVFGSLLIIMIVLALIYTGILSTPLQTTAPDSTEIDSASDSEKSAPDTAPAVTVNTPPPSSNPVEPSVAKIQDTAVSENPEVSNTSKTAEALPAASSTDAAITYEDFREESQNTLYRETND